MSEREAKRRGKASYRPPKDFEAEFYAAVSHSGLTTNAFLTNALKQFIHGNHNDQAMHIKLARLLSDVASIKALAEAGDLSSDALAAEMQMIRTALMRLTGRKS